MFPGSTEYLTKPLKDRISELEAELESCTEKNWSKKLQLDQIIDALNEPQRESEYVAQEVIRILDLEHTKNGWHRKSTIDSDKGG